MPDQANISSIEALESFLHSLVVYREKSAAAVDEARMTIQRFQSWLKHEQKSYWQREVRARGRALEEAKQEWFNSRMSGLQAGGVAEVACQRARASLREAESKLAAVLSWGRLCDSRIDPLASQVDRMYNLLAEDLPKSIAYLSQVVNTLGSYAERSPPREPTPAPEAAPGAAEPPAGATP